MPGLPRNGASVWRWTFELLHQIRFQVRAAGDLGDLEQRRQRDVMFARVLLSQKEREALEQVLEAQQRANSLVERILVKNQARSPLG